MTTDGFWASYGMGIREFLACAVTGAIYGCLLLFIASPVAAISGAILAAVVLLISVTDARLLLIPDLLSLPLLPLGIAVSASLSEGPWEQVVLERIGAAATAAGTLYTIRWVYRRFRQVEGLGLGDVKLMAAAGAWVGFDALWTTLLLASLAALAATLVRHCLYHGAAAGVQKPVPFGSFIAPALLIVWSAGQWGS